MKKAIVVVSFGTSYEKAIKDSIEAIENDIKAEFKEYDHFRAFTSHMIIKKIMRVRGEKINTPEETLEHLIKEGYEEVVIQPLHMMAAEEFDYIKNIAIHYGDKFKDMKLGRPILYYQGIEGVSDDYSLFIDSIKEEFLKDKATVLFGHGTAHPSGSCYGALQAILEDEGYENVFVGTVDGYPTFETVMKRLNKRGIKEVLLMPIMIVCGDHALNDMASSEEDSWKSRFEANGVKVHLNLKGLGEIERFRKLYINRIHDVIEMRYLGIGKTKKGKKKHENTSNSI